MRITPIIFPLQSKPDLQPVWIVSPVMASWMTVFSRFSHTHSLQHFPGRRMYCGWGQSGVGRRPTRGQAGTQLIPPPRHWQWLSQVGWKNWPSWYVMPFSSQPWSSRPASSTNTYSTEVQVTCICSWRKSQWGWIWRSLRANMLSDGKVC